MHQNVIKKTALFASILSMSLFMTLGTHAFAADGAELYTAKGCGACHGADGNSPITGAYPKIAGQNLEYITQQLKDIKSGARSNGQSVVMKGIMAAVSDEEITAISEHLASLK